MNKKDLVAPVSKNEQLEMDIVDLSYEGLGVAKIDNYPVFVTNALPGERAVVRIIKVKKNFAFGKVMRRFNDAEIRVELRDEDGLRTGTMPLQHMTYDAQLDFKHQQVVNSLSKFNLLNDDIEVLPTIGMENPWEYRNKAQVPITGKDGELQTGFFRKNSHDIIPMENFQIQLPGIDALLQKIIKGLNAFHISGYNERTHKGLIRNLVVRRGYYTNQFMIVLVLNGKRLPNEEAIVEDIIAGQDDIVSVILNTNTRRTNVIMGDQQRTLFGSDTIEDKMFDYSFNISSRSFFQINTPQAEKLYQAALSLADLKGTETVIDAYSGIGTISLSLAKQARHVYAIESVKDSVEMAKENAQINGVENVTFEVGKAEDVMKEWAGAGLLPQVVVVDPPRKGLDEEFINSVLEVSPEKIIYVSCNPATFARDINKFVEAGYTLGNVQPLDMFPQTQHVEAVTLLTRAAAE